MGWIIVSYKENHEQLQDDHVWILRNFLLRSTRKLERVLLASEFAALIEFFESWQWFGPGVIAGVELDAFIGSNKSRLALLLQILNACETIITGFGDVIPKQELNAILITDFCIYTEDMPSRRLVEDVARLRKILLIP